MIINPSGFVKIVMKGLYNKNKSAKHFNFIFCKFNEMKVKISINENTTQNLNFLITRLHSGLDHEHMNHECLKDVWITENPEQTYLVDAIVRLGNEAQPNFQEKCRKMGYFHH